MHRAVRALAMLGAAMVSGLLQAQTPVIEGVVAQGTPIELVREGFKATEGPVADGDGLLFTDNQANQILRVAADGSVSVWTENTGGANALTRTPRGELIATLVGDKVIAAMEAGKPPRVLASEFSGMPFNRPNDIVASSKGVLYFTDTAAVGATSPALPSAVYELSSNAGPRQFTTDIARPNGVALSPDERTLYVANTAGEWIVAFDVDTSGRVGGSPRNFARLVMPPVSAQAPSAAAGAAPAAPSSGADGIAVDVAGRVFVATTVGVQVFSVRGEPLGIIQLPKVPQNLAFAGPGLSTLFVVGRGAVYRISTKTRGPDRAGK